MLLQIVKSKLRKQIFFNFQLPALPSEHTVSPIGRGTTYVASPASQRKDPIHVSHQVLYQREQKVCMEMWWAPRNSVSTVPTLYQNLSIKKPGHFMYDT